MDWIWWTGFAVLSWLLYRVSRFAYFHFFYDGAPLLAALAKSKSQGDAKSWAVVTGASYGIGRSFAIALAKRGFNVALLARSKQQLEELAQLVQKDYGVRAKVITCDFLAFAKEEKLGEKGEDGLGVYERIFQQLDPLDVALLVNNVGGLPEKDVKLYGEFAWDEEEAVRYLNAVPLQHLVKYAIKRMTARGSGGIINVSSLASKISVQLGPYAFQKSGINALTEFLQAEYEKQNIKFQLVLSGAVSTPGFNNPKTSFMLCSADRMAEDTLRHFGSTTITVPYIGHALALQLMNLLPTAVAFSFIHKAMVDVKKQVKAAKRN